MNFKITVKCDLTYLTYWNRKSDQIESRRKIHYPEGTEAGIMRWVFHSLSAEKFNTEQIWKQALAKS